MTKPRTVGLVCGGVSPERTISVVSARRLAASLGTLDIETVFFEPDETLLASISGVVPDAIINVLHGERGEDGSVAQILELTGIPFLGPRHGAARLSFDKSAAKTLLASAGVATPRSCTIPYDMFQTLRADPLIELMVARHRFPMIVKPNRGGSGLGIELARDADDLRRALVGCFEYCSVALVEEYVDGVEVAVTVTDHTVLGTLPLVKLEYLGDSWRYETRYTPDLCRLTAPANLPSEQERAARDAALTAYHVLGLTDLARIDMIIPATGEPHVLEATASPGLAPVSAVPAAARAAGLTIGEVYAPLITRLLAIDGSSCSP